jgi:hypothetical protein
MKDWLEEVKNTLQEEEEREGRKRREGRGGERMISGEDKRKVLCRGKKRKGEREERERREKSSGMYHIDFSFQGKQKLWSGNGCRIIIALLSFLTKERKKERKKDGRQ